MQTLNNMKLTIFYKEQNVNFISFVCKYLDVATQSSLYIFIQKKNDEGTEKL